MLLDKLRKKWDRLRNFHQETVKKEVEEKKDTPEKILHEAFGFVPMSEESFREFCRAQKKPDGKPLYTAKQINQLVHTAKTEKGGFRKRPRRDTLAQNAIVMVQPLKRPSRPQTKQDLCRQ